MQTTATQTPAPSKPFVTAIRQVGLVTGDLNSTLRELANRFGIGPFNCWHLASRQLFGRKFRGAPVPWTINLAIAWVGQMQLEVIQPLTGPSSLAEYLNSTGEGGIHHLLVATGNLKLAPAIRRFKSLGCPVDLEGYANLPAQIGPLTILPIPKFAAQRLSTHFAYLNTQHIAGTTLEVSQLPPLMPFRVGMSIAKPQYRIPLPGPNRLVKEINKVGIITPNLDRLLSSYTHQLGIGPWRITTLDTTQPAQSATLRGEPVHFKARIARADVGGTTIELVQPLEGSSLYAEWLDRHGEGVHYLGVTTTPTSWPQILDRFASAGSPALMQSHPEATPRYAYFDTAPQIKTTLEVSI